MKSSWRHRILLVFFFSVVSVTLIFAQAGRNLASTGTQPVPPPEQSLGFKIGTDRKLAKWERFVAYFEHLDAASERMTVENLGKTTLGRPFIVATISAPENLKRLDELKLIQRRLADPRLINQDANVANDLIQRGKTIVVITCSIHSTEVGGTFTATELAYRLTSSNAPEIRQILDNTIILLVPSLNPDGTDIVADWYQKTLGTPAEGTAPPELYHHYTGHDNNRDWYAFTQVETQLTVDRILNVWHPNILHDIHQQGAYGARMFVPPYVEPWEPNIDPALIAGVSALGSAMAWELTAQGKSGVVINGIYDSWTPARAYAHYHGALRILSETASARLATTIEVPFARLSPGIGYNAKVSSWNFPQPWLGGQWTIANIVDYQTSAAMALLHHAARYREQYLRSFYDINVRAIAPKPDIYAYLLLEPAFPKSLAADEEKLVNSGKNETAKTEKEHKEDDAAMKKMMNAPASSEEVNYYYKIEGLDRTLGILKRGGVEVLNAAKEFTADGKTYPKGTHIILMQQPYSSFAKTLLERQQYPDLREYPGGPPKRPYDVVAHTLPLLMNVEAIPVKTAFTVDGRREPSALVLQSRVRSNTSGARIGLYQNYSPAMDEGWTRWLFDQYKFPYTRVKQEEIRGGFLHAKFDTIILPDQSARALAEGLPASNSAGEEGGVYPKEFTGGLGQAGIKALREFVEAGGTLMTFNNASNFAIEHLGVPVRNVLQGVPARQFYCPGSILRTQLDSGSNLTFGMEKESIAWFEQSPAFEVLDEKSVRVIARYPNDANPLLSGWILGDQLLRGKAALVEAKMGKGRVIMFGFRPQYRAQSLATFPLLFNAILTSKAE
ncbi:MAG TPA: M14 metallopeptidase family protein [Blastocatellia bacterium]|nr:M14 metallopeptidase family protein [Blastocatellia bacterium]